MEGLSKAELKAQRYYQACMSEAKIEALGAQPLQGLINQVRYRPSLWRSRLSSQLSVSLMANAVGFRLAAGR